MESVVDKLIEFSGGKDEELRDISALGASTLRCLDFGIYHDNSFKDHYCGTASGWQDRGERVCQVNSQTSRADSERMSSKRPPVPSLISSQKDTPPEALVEILSILSVLLLRFPQNLTSLTFTPHPLVTLAPLLSHARPVVRKKAIITISQYIPLSQPDLVTDLLKTNVFPFLVANAPLDKQRTTVQLISALARHSPIHIAAFLADVVPGTLKAAQRDDDELREGSLQVRAVWSWP